MVRAFGLILGSKMLITAHQLLGVDDEEIVKDYTLTTIGLEPALPGLVKRFKAHDVYRDNWEGTMNMSSSKWVHRTAFFLEPTIDTTLKA